MLLRDGCGFFLLVCSFLALDVFSCIFNARSHSLPKSKRAHTHMLKWQYIRIQPKTPYTNTPPPMYPPPPKTKNLNSQQRPPRLIPQLHPPKLLLPKTPHLAIPSKAEIRTPALNQHFPNQHAAAVPDINAVAATAVHVAKDVALDAIGRAVVGVREDAAVGQVRLRVLFPEDGEGVDGGGALGVGAAVAVDEVRVGDVHGFFRRGKADAVRPTKAVGHDADVARFGHEAVDVLGELGFGPEALFVAVDGVGEPDGAVRGDDDVVGGVEGARVVVVE